MKRTLTVLTAALFAAAIAVPAFAQGEPAAARAPAHWRRALLLRKAAGQ